MAVVLCCPQGTVLDVTVLSPTNGVGCPQGMVLVSPYCPQGTVLLDVFNEWCWCHRIVPKERRWMSP